VVIGELGRWSLWAAVRRVRGWLGHPVWKAVRPRTRGELRRLAEAHGLVVCDTRGAIHYPPCGIAATVAEPFDRCLGRRMTGGAAFLAVAAIKPLPNR
jgi:hypothetical protein